MNRGLSLALVTLAATSLAQAPDGYADEQAKWRAEYEARIKAERGWLSVAGLFWLAEGETTVGTAPSSGLLLPAGSAPPKVGVLTRKGDKISLRVEEGVALEVRPRIDEETDAHVADGVAEPES